MILPKNEVHWKCVAWNFRLSGIHNLSADRLLGKYWLNHHVSYLLLSHPFIWVTGFMWKILINKWWQWKNSGWIFLLFYGFKGVPCIYWWWYSRWKIEEAQNASILENFSWNFIENTDMFTAQWIPG
jgi:hypothetical protein